MSSGLLRSANQPAEHAFRFRYVTKPTNNQCSNLHPGVLLVNAGGNPNPHTAQAQNYTGAPIIRKGVSGDEGARTLNPRLAKPVLSQLSYVPRWQDEPEGNRENEEDIAIISVVAWPTSPCARDSISLPPIACRSAFLVQATSATKWAHQDSNLGPRRYQRRALTN